jgi:acyl-homoserine-lactone acylase
MFKLFLTVTFLACIVGCTTKPDTSTYLSLATQYNVVIQRDTYGVPHVKGQSDADAAFGLAYAQSEDHWPLLEDAILLYRGQSAKYKGPDAAVTDFLVKWLGIWEDIDADYEKQLKPETRAYLQAFADGLSYYAAKHPEQVRYDLLPYRAQDLVAGGMLQHLLFWGFDATVQELTSESRVRDISAGPGVLRDGAPIGSNAFAVAPHFSTDGATRLAVNSHQPATGPVAWYEAHIESNEGLNAMGGLLPGGPTISVGFTENTTWAATVNKPDLIDVYVLEINPDNPMQYRLDGEWLDLEERDLDIEVQLLGFIPWTVTEQGLRSVHGPVIATEHGTYAIRYAGMGEMRQMEQWLAMDKASNLKEFRDAMRIHAFSSFNFAYADREGNIMFVHNSLTPIRKGGYDWQQYLPGDDSSLIWNEFIAYDDLPQVINPASGYVHSANQSPFFVSGTADNPNADDYRQEDGFPTRMTNRAYRGLELFEQLGPISEKEFFDIKHDKVYSENSRSYAYVQAAIALEGMDQPYIAAQSLLQDWNYDTDIDNRGAALGTCVLGAEWVAESKGRPVPDVRDELIRCTDLLLSKVGKIDPLWGDVNRHIRGDLNLPVGGGPDTLRAIYATGMEEDGYMTNIAGDGLYYLVSWDKNGKQKIRGTHQFGSATLDETSPHYGDQAQDYVNEVLRDPWFDPALREGNIEHSYAP